MMYVCPLCNKLGQKNYQCPTCLTSLEDCGRLMDYFDNYSPYLEIDGTKLVDGYPNDQKNHQCPHVFYCPNCLTEQVYLIDEIIF
ncbi:hypothetical protein [Calidifontibacillus erzurumensis]|nr:hypothetical protein [Calidifontibacillus erzurumensis]